MLSALLALQLLASPQTPPPVVSGAAASPADKQPQVVTWYGLQTIIADGSAVLLTGTGFVLLSTLVDHKPGNTFTGVGIGLFFVVTPIVHLVHGNGLGALLSVGVRLLSLWGAGAVGAVVSVFRHGLFTGQTHNEEIYIALVAGQVLAGVIDAQRIAFEPTPTDWLPGLFASTLRLAPFASSVRGAPVAGLAAQF